MKIYLSCIFILILALTGCNAIKIEQDSTIALPNTFEHMPQGSMSVNLQQWWLNWQDAVLIELIEQGLANNLDLILAQARLSEAQAGYSYAYADLGPQLAGNVSSGAGVSRTKIDTLSEATTSGSGSIYGGISASWELDFFGKKRSDADAAFSLMLAQQEQLYATQMLISSQIAQNYFSMIATVQQKSLIVKNIQNLQMLERYLKGRFESGQATAYEINEISSQISTQQARLALFDSRYDGYQRQIALLLGLAPQGFNIKPNLDLLEHIPPLPQGQQPDELIQRRPDLRSARHRVDAQAAQLASANADLYPRFSLDFMGQGGYIRLDSDISQLSGALSMLSLGIQLPIFTNGRLQANIDSADARLRQALIEYDSILLTALAEVDNSYQQHFALEQQLDLSLQASEQLEQRARDAQSLFKNNRKTLDSALLADNASLSEQEQVLQTRFNLALNWLELYKALGGGWTE